MPYFGLADVLEALEKHKNRSLRKHWALYILYG